MMRQASASTRRKTSPRIGKGTAIHLRNGTHEREDLTLRHTPERNRAPANARHASQAQNPQFVAAKLYPYYYI